MMKKRSAVAVFVTLVFGALTGCATATHTGRVQQVTDDGQAVLRLSRADSSTAGQAYEVYRKQPIMYGNPSKQPISSYRTRTVGCVQVTQVLDSHHVKAAVMGGSVEERDLTRPSGSSCPLRDRG